VERSVPAQGLELMTGRVIEGLLQLPAGGVAVVREPRVAS
jgi:hypothetical protein